MGIAINCIGKVVKKTLFFASFFKKYGEKDKKALKVDNSPISWVISVNHYQIRPMLFLTAFMRIFMEAPPRK
jgi:hypothetical protein